MGRSSTLPTLSLPRIPFMNTPLKTRFSSSGEHDAQCRPSQMSFIVYRKHFLLYWMFNIPHELFSDVISYSQWMKCWFYVILVSLYASLSLTVMPQRPKDSASSTNVPQTGTTPMKTTAAFTTPTFTPVLLRSWSVLWSQLKVLLDFVTLLLKSLK